MENTQAAPPVDSPETARLRARHRWITRAAVLNGVIWLITCAIGWMQSWLPRAGVGSDYVVWVVLLTTPLMFVSIFVSRYADRVLNHQIRRDVAAQRRSADAVVTAIAPVLYPSPAPDTPETARIRARHERRTRVLLPLMLISVGVYVILAGIGSHYVVYALLTAILLISAAVFAARPTSSALAERQRLDRAAHRQSELADAARTVVAPVVYLRSFADDDRAGRRYGALTEEEQLTKALAWVGPLLAVGRPGERLPQVGAQRIYLTDEGWQQRVTELMTRAALVVLRTGSSEGFYWEVTEAVSTLTPERLLLVADSGPELRTVLTAIARVVGHPATEVRSPGPPIGTVTGLVMFGPDWSPQPLRLPRGMFRATQDGERFVGRFTLALRPLFDRLGVAYQLPPLSRARMFAALFVLLSAIAIAVANFLDPN